MRRGGPIGPLATLTGEPGQARKGAAVVRDACAEVWLVGPSLFIHLKFQLSQLISNSSLVHIYYNFTSGMKNDLMINVRVLLHLRDMHYFECNK